MLTLYGALRAFGVHPNVITMVLAYATSYVISALPLPAGGAGGIEGREPAPPQPADGAE